MDFNLISVVTKNYGISYDGKVPWIDEQYNAYFDELTKDGILVMGRKTFENLPDIKRPFSDRLTVVLSNDYMKYSHLENNRLIFVNMYNLVNRVLELRQNRSVWIVGGAEVYKQLMPMCQKVYITLLDKNVQSAITFPDMPPYFELMKYSQKGWSDNEQCDFRVLEYHRNMNSPCRNHELQYLVLLRKLTEIQKPRLDRTGTGTVGFFGNSMRYDVSKYLPLLTTKFVPIKMIIKELLWFLRGQTDVKVLQKEGVHIWDGNSTREFLDSRGLTHLEEGDLGYSYGMLWRHFGAEYKDCHTDYSGQGADQIKYIINELKTNPFSRRILMSSWNPPQLNNVALPPCHVLFQLYVEEDDDGNKHLSGQLYQRSQDTFLAANYNLIEYTILLYILAKKCDMYPKEMIHTMGDVHLYLDHIEAAKEQLTRHPRPQPILELDNSIVHKEIEDITIDDFELIGYMPYPSIRAKMSV